MSKVRVLASLVKLEHTVFALPFAYAGMVVGAEAPGGAGLSVQLVLLVTLAMVGARTLAMALNRLIDEKIDARNPRTAARELPAGAVTRAQVWLLCAASLALLVGATFGLDPVTRVLWPIPVALFVIYPYTKRFTWLCHLVLGLSIGLAPLAAWLAAGAGAGSPVPWLLWWGVGLWIAGFDIIYATADVEFDRGAGIKAVPAVFGLGPALTITRVLHVLAIGCFAGAGVTGSLGVAFWPALALAAALLAWENRIVKPHDLSRIDHAFFTVNSWVGVVLGAGVVAGQLL